MTLLSIQSPSACPEAHEVAARTQHIPAWKVIGEHLLIALSVVIVSYYVGLWVSDLQL